MVFLQRMDIEVQKSWPEQVVFLSSYWVGDLGMQVEMQMQCRSTHVQEARTKQPKGEEMNAKVSEVEEGE